MRAVYFLKRQTGWLVALSTTYHIPICHQLRLGLALHVGDKAHASDMVDGSAEGFVGKSISPAGYFPFDVRPTLLDCIGALPGPVRSDIC